MKLHEKDGMIVDEECYRMRGALYFKSLLPEHEAQLINYLKSAKMKLGFLVNFCHFPKADIRTYIN